MTKKTEQEKKCQDCKYYLQHYIKRSSTFVAVCYGHCININAESCKVRLLGLRECWEDNITGEADISKK